VPKTRLPIPVPPAEGGLPDRLIHGWLLLAAQRSDRTGETYLDAFNRVAGFLPADPRRLTPDGAAWIYRWLVERFSVRTANTSLYALRSLWRYLQEQGWADGNPWQAVRPQRPKDTRAERILTEEQVRKLLRNAPPGPERLFLRVLYYCGLRVSEAVNLRWRDFHRDQQGWAVTIYGKGQKTRTVHLRDDLWAALQALPGPRHADARLFPWSRVRGWRAVKRAAERAGVPLASPHWLRHSHASHALDRGAPIHVVQATLGHARLSTTEGYLHVRPGVGSGTWLPDD